jgi:hypothetical protein
MTITARAGKNVWGRCDDWGQVVEFVAADEMPDGDGWFAHYPASRVRGDTYEPYAGRTAWECEANAAMASKANSNFRRREGH